MSTTLQLPQAIEAALQRINPSTSRRNFLASSGALVLSGVSACATALAFTRRCSRSSVFLRRTSFTV